MKSLTQWSDKRDLTAQDHIMKWWRYATEDLLYLSTFFSLVGNSGRLTQQPQEHCYPLLSVCVVFSCVQTVVWLAVLGIFNVNTNVDASHCTRGLHGHRKRVCTGSALRASLSGTSLQTLPDLVTPLKGALFISAAQLSTDAVSALRMVWVLIKL